MAAHLHHRIPRSLLKVYDLGHGPGLESEDLAAYFEWEEEAFLYRVNPDVSRDELIRLIKGSTVKIAEEEHKTSHSAAGDFVRWGRLGGLKTLERYGRPWFALLGRRRWGRVSAGGASALGRSTTTGHSSRQRWGRLERRPIFHTHLCTFCL